MPELPEVQTIVDDLNKKIIGRKITGVWFDAPKLIKKPKAGELEKLIKGLKISGIKRRGKNILIYLIHNRLPISNYLLLVHQKMTGHLLIGKWLMVNGKPKSQIKGQMQEKVNNYIHVIFYFDNGSQLALSDLRKFAKIIFGTKEEIESLPEIIKLGVDALDKKLTFKKFLELMGGKNKSIKEILMDQNIISGIGNIYADEILWLAKVHPLIRANQLKVKQLKIIYNAIKIILEKAVKLRGTSISDFRDTSGNFGHYADVRYVYRKEGKPCPRCKTPIKRIKVKGRSAHYCPVCQRL